jgi:uncharacterized DUF497 family protein
MIDDVVYNGQFVWNRQKNERNTKEHSISFEQAVESFYDMLAIYRFDEENSVYEDRYNITGFRSSGKFSCVTVTFTIRGDMKRIISARKADSEEKEVYDANVREKLGIR